MSELRVEIMRAVRDIATPVVIVGDDLVPLDVGLTNAGVDMIADAIMALIEQSRPSREAFAAAVDEFGRVSRASSHASEPWESWRFDREKIEQEVKLARREVIRMAGYGEEE